MCCASEDWRLDIEDLVVELEITPATALGAGSSSHLMADFRVGGTIHKVPTRTVVEIVDEVMPEFRDMLAMCAAARRWATERCRGRHGSFV